MGGSFSRTQAVTAKNNANTQVLKNALAKYIAAIKNVPNANRVRSIMNTNGNFVNANGKALTKSYKNRIANGIAVAAYKAKMAVKAAQQGKIPEGKAAMVVEEVAMNVNNTTNNINRVYIMNTILKNTNLKTNSNKIQAMINYNPKVNFKSLVRPVNSPELIKLFTNANNAANAKYGPNRKNKAPFTKPSEEKGANAASIPVGMFNENRAAAAELRNAFAKANAITNKSTRANINAAYAALNRANKMYAKTQANKNAIRNRRSAIERIELLMPPAPPVNKNAKARAAINKLWGFAGTGSNSNKNQAITSAISAATRARVLGELNLTGLNRAQLNAILASNTFVPSSNQSGGNKNRHVARVKKILNSLYAPIK